MNSSTMTTTQRTTDGTTMQAITQDRYGEAEDVLRTEEIARPPAGSESWRKVNPKREPVRRSPPWASLTLTTCG